MTYHRPGTYVDEVLLTQQAPLNATVAVGAFLAPAARGPVVPTRYESFTDVRTALGGFTADPAKDRLIQAVYDYFNNGGRVCYVCRAVGTGAVSATLDFLLAATPGPGAAALALTADNPGTWGNHLYVEVTAGSDATRFNLTVRMVPTGAAITNAQIVERWSDLSLDPVDSRYALGVLNNATGGSNYLVASLAAGYVFTAGDVITPSSTPGGDPLASGADGAAPSATQIQDAVPLFDVVTQPFVLNLPGETRTAVITTVANYVDPARTRDDDSSEGRGDVFVVVDTDPGADGDSAITKAATYPKSDYLAVYYPNLVVADPSNAVAGATKLVPAGPAVVGRYIATDAARGPFKSPAGIVDGALVGVVALDPAAVLRNPLLDRLNDANVNAIKIIPNRGPIIFGARTRKSSFITRYVSARRTIIQARADLVEATAFGPFENNDQILWSGLENAADKVCRQLFIAGGLKGATPEQAYYVKADSDNNNASTVEAGEVHLEVGLAVQRPAEFVVLTIAQFDGGATVIEDAASNA